jgi:hypothetical protein
VEKKQFEEEIKAFLKSKGFEKMNNRYYLNSNDFLCEIYVQKSCFGDVSYINYYFYLGSFQKPYLIDRGGVMTHTPYVGSRFYFTNEDKYSCAFLNYSELQLYELLETNFNERIKPPFEKGKQYLLEHFGTLYTSFLNDEIIKPLLQQ